MSQSNPVSISTANTEIDGLEHLFDVTPSSAKADTSQKKIVEVSISEAARRLGTSERTIWRRINRGELKSRTKGTKRFVKVPLFEPTAFVDSDGHTTLSDTPTKASALVDLHALWKDLQAATYRIGYLEAQLQNHQEQVKLLPDLQAKASEVAKLREQLAARDAELAQFKTSWWRRFVGYMTRDI